MSRTNRLRGRREENKIVKQMIEQSKEHTSDIDEYSKELVYTVIDTVCDIMEEECEEQGRYMREVVENKLCFDE